MGQASTSPSIDLTSLNPEQRRAVECVDGRVLVLAGAGSGKTRVLTTRMAHLIRNLGVSPSAILGLTFTNKAAEEMRERMASLIGPKLAKDVTLCTFHGLCMQILREHIHHLGYASKFTLYDEQDITRLIKLIARDELDHEGEMPSVNATLAAIAHARNRGLTPEEMPSSGKEWLDRFNRTAYQRLDESLRAYNALDFDSLLTHSVKLLREHPSVLSAYHSRYKYLLIDEYQDTNPIQYELAELLSAGSGCLCVVGDDDQSIYGWRGAEVRNILNFSNAELIKLEQNYRSTNTILKAANAVIRENSDRFEKALWSDCGAGQRIEVFVAPNEQKEAQAVVHRIAEMKKNAGLRWKDVAVLYRSNALSRHIEKELMQYSWADGSRWVRGIPYRVFGGTAFYDRKEVKDLLAYLRILVNPKDEQAILRVINQPRRGLGEQGLQTLRDRAKEERSYLWSSLVDATADWGLSRRALGGCADFVATIRQGKELFHTLPFAEAMERFLERIDYTRAIAEEVKSEKMRQFTWENVCELVTALGEYQQEVQRVGEEADLGEFLAKSGLDRDDRGRKDKQVGEDSVSLMTIHSAKGLEFPACFLIALEDEIIPHARSAKEGSIAEERRLMYVALTRAKHYLCCSMAATRMRMGRTGKSKPSRFMLDIPKDLLKVTRWDAG
jgi:superfamily I DNA/RNA helicase